MHDLYKYSFPTLDDDYFNRHTYIRFYMLEKEEKFKKKIKLEGQYGSPLKKKKNISHV